MHVSNNTHKTVEIRQQLLDEIERIEKLPRIQRWQAIRDFTLKMHPGFIPAELDFIAAVTEIREINNFKTTGASKSLDLRHVMKLPQYIYSALTTMDPDLLDDMSGRNPERQKAIIKQLWTAFPMYRAARKY